MKAKCKVITKTFLSSDGEAFIVLGQLKEAYLLAAKMDSMITVRLVRDEADVAGNKRVVQLCDQFLSTHKTDMAEEMQEITTEVL